MELQLRGGESTLLAGGDRSNAAHHLEKRITDENLRVKHLAIDLCLTVPARLSSLLPYIPFLMKSVIRALQVKTVHSSVCMGLLRWIKLNQICSKINVGKHGFDCCCVCF